MKRIAFVAALLVIVAAVVYGATAITVNPSEMKNGETKTLVDGNKSITIRRAGDDIDIKIEGGGTARNLTVSRAGDGTIRIEHDGRRRIDVGPGGPRVFIDGMDFKNMTPSLRGMKAQTWFVCPKDHSMLRVPAGKESDTFKCPVDGTTMERRKGPGFAFFFDDDWFESDSL